MHLGKMSGSRVAGGVEPMRASRSSQSIPGTPLLAAMRSPRPLRAQLLEMEAGKGRSSSTSIKPTVASKVSSPKTRSSAAKKQSALRSREKQKKYAQQSSHCFVMGLLITPSGMRLPFSVSYYTEAYCRRRRSRTASRPNCLSLIRQLPLPPEAHVVVLGDTAFDAKAIRTACEERNFSDRAHQPRAGSAGEKPRPRSRRCLRI